MSNIEEEVIILKAVKELIDTIVNFELLTLHRNDPDSSILFETVTHQRFFNIIPVDFLSRTDKRGPIKQTSYLGGLRMILNNPSFDAENSARFLKDATYEFIEWLEQVVEVDIWLPSISTDTILKVSRINFLKMCGNISKHNYLGSLGIAKDLRKILAE